MTAITSAGFVRTRQDEIIELLKAGYRAIYGVDIDVETESPDGQLVNILGEAFSDLAQKIEEVYNGRSPSGASGAALSRIARLNGVTRKPASYSIVPITLTGTPGTVIPAGSLIGSTDSQQPIPFQTTTSLTIGGGATVTGQARATESGPIPASAGDLTVILSVIAGWTNVTNTSDASEGVNAETDAALRIRRAESVAIPSQGVVDGLYAALAQLDDVTHVAVYENPSNAVDVNGLPAHSIKVIVDGGLNADIANAIWLKKSLGVTQVGAVTGDIVDSQGRTQTMKWDVPVDTPIYVTVELDDTVSAGTKTAIQDAIVAWGEANAGIGEDVNWGQLFVPVNDVIGASDVKVLQIKVGNAPSPVLQAPFPIAFNAIARWDVSRIVVNP